VRTSLSGRWGVYGSLNFAMALSALSVQRYWYQWLMETRLLRGEAKANIELRLVTDMAIMIAAMLLLLSSTTHGRLAHHEAVSRAATTDIVDAVTLPGDFPHEYTILYTCSCHGLSESPSTTGMWKERD